MIDRLATINLSSQPRTTISGGSPEVPQIDIFSKTNNSGNTIELPNVQKTKEQVEDIVIGLNRFLKPSNASIKFEFHEKLNEYYVTLVDDITHEVIREIPPKKMLDMFAAMTEFMGLLVDRKI
ncbi:flagellar protein FlaG [Bacillus sp. V59.32b]|uniref:flagellar protein FlaG n=1 Tax=Bacillus sp. V59.32b TaxID=1758642 RepID=UPI000E3E5CEC|nr:flagellar protein FlaG [Bacillus sp. V59.32b]RFU67427.1 flagellar protein FlaG [Bacillus sp. V59.32b]